MTSGATFKKFDLHLHAPGPGQNFKLPNGEKSPETAAERLEFARRYLEQARGKAGLDLIAITNHNDTSWIDPLRCAAKNLYGEEFIVLPGVEVGADSGTNSIHILAIFPEDTVVEQIERMLDEDLGLPPDKRFINGRQAGKGGAPRPSQRSFADVVGAITKRGGIAVAAHVFSDDGLLASKSNRGVSRQDQFCCPDLRAIEVNKGRLEELPDWEYAVVTNTHEDPNFRRERPIACLNGSDARQLEEIGRSFTWVKCEKPSFRALKHALLDPQSRLRLRDQAILAPSVHLDNLTVALTHSGFLSGLAVEINPLLNCLIGGRGTGKSAIIELIRYLWGQSPLKPAELQGFLDVFFPETAEAAVEVTGDSGRYRVHRIGRKAVHVSRREGDEWLLTELRPGDVCPIDIYGQKEILYTSQNVRSQLDLVDRLVGDEIRVIKIERDELLLRLRRNRETMVVAYEQVQDKRGRLERKAAVEEQLSQYYRSGIGDLAQTKRLYDRELQAWENAIRQIREAEELATTAHRRACLDLGYLDEKEIALLPSRGLLEALRERLTTLSQITNRSLVQLLEHLREAQTDVEAQRGGWIAKRAVFDEEYARALAALPGLTPDAVTRLERERLELEQMERELKARCDELKGLAAERLELLTELSNNTQRQFEARRHKAEEITERLKPRVSVDVLRSGDLEWLSEQFRRVLSGSRLRTEDYSRLADQASNDLLGVLAAIEAADTEMPDGVRIYETWLSPTNNTWLEPSPVERLAQISGLGDKAGKLVEYLPFARRLELDESQVPDRAVVRLNIARPDDSERPDDTEMPDENPKKRNWRALGQRLGEGVSVGQGCTAILSIIMLQSTHPLIIDQPEDDLDNRFIYDEIVKILRRWRGQRQMLIATHNANIPVAGDAEQIIALDAQEIAEDQTDMRCKVVASGFVDTTEVSTQVQLILEGGRAAFLLRREKYGF